MQLKQILFFHPSADLYGSDKILVYILKNYIGFSKTLILPVRGPLLELLEKECPDVKVIISPDIPLIAKKYFTPKGVFRFFNQLLRFRRFLKDNHLDSPEILYLNTLAMSPLLFFFNGRNTKKIVHVHEILPNSSLIHKIINNTGLRWSDRVVCVSNAVLNNLKELQVNPHKLTLIHNGISFSSESEVSSPPFEVDSNKTNFTLIGRIKPEKKGHKFLLDAIRALPDDILNKSHFYFVGSPVKGQEYMLNDLEEYIDRLALKDYVSIIPFVKQIESVYNQIDVSIVPSIEEDSFPTTILESMYFSSMVIGTRIGGIPEMIIDGQTGFIVDKKNPEELTEKIAWCINNTNKVREMGKNGKSVFESNFTTESFNNRYRLFIDQLYN